MRASLTVLCLAATLLPACANLADDRATVSALRVLGIRAEPPEAAPGASVALDALVADPEGAGRPIAWKWALCAPDVTLGAASCEDPARLTVLSTTTSAGVTVDPGVLDGLPPEQRLRGIDLYVVLEVDAGSETVVSYKTIRVSTSPAPNANPSLASFTVDGLSAPPVVVAPGTEVDLAAAATAGSLETYTDSTGAPATEEMRFTWLQTAGTMEDPVSFAGSSAGAATRWTAPDGPAKLWVVLRDGRGGIDWAMRDVTP